MKQPQEKATRAPAVQPANRIKAAARLSRDTPPSEICEVLDISVRTLKRYAKDPRWQENGGVELPRYFFEKPTGRHRDLNTEKRLIAEAYRLRGDGMTWIAVAARLGLSVRQLEYLRSKYC